MSRHWMHIGNRAWAPRALAVISCALALLAAQPVLSQAHPQSTPLPLTSPASAAAHFDAADRRLPLLATPSVSRRETPFFTSARRLHILATVEILKRLLIAELQPTHERILLPALLLESTDCIELVAAPLNLPGNRGAPDYPCLPPPEQQFLLEHTQLAPPTV